MMEPPVGLNDLVVDTMYGIYHSGGCKGMETKITRKFVGLNEQGNPLFYDESMGIPVIFNLDNKWEFYNITR